jgi:hypothetical protein
MYYHWTAGSTWLGASVCFESRESLTNGRLQPMRDRMKAWDDRAPNSRSRENFTPTADAVIPRSTETV